MNDLVLYGRPRVKGGAGAFGDLGELDRTEFLGLGVAHTFPHPLGSGEWEVWGAAVWAGGSVAENLEFRHHPRSADGVPIEVTLQSSVETFREHLRRLEREAKEEAAHL